MSTFFYKRVLLFESPLWEYFYLMITVFLFFSQTTGCMRNNGDQVSNIITIHGAKSGDNLGRSVSLTGDINGDGFPDIIVGAPFYDRTDPFDEIGAAYIILGGQNVNKLIEADTNITDANFPDFILFGEAKADCFGATVSGVGDVDGDGFDDFIVGAPRDSDCNVGPNSGSSGPGLAYLFLGSNNLQGNLTADQANLILTRGQPGDLFGFSIADAGDVNGDGFSDFIIGMPFNSNNGKTNNGEALLYFGGIGIDNIPDLILVGTNNGDLFGLSVSGAGDTNGDGFDDFVIGAPGIIGSEGRCSGKGAAYLYFGGTITNSIPDAIFVGENTNDCFGTAVAGAGDVNGEGLKDILIGAPRNDNNGLIDNGSVYIFFGNSIISGTIQAGSGADIILKGSQNNDFLGTAVAGVGDINRDGFSDVLVGATGRDSGKGMAELFLGENLSNELQSFRIFFGNNALESFGSSLAGSEDINGDGHIDIIIGAPLNSNGGWTNNGKASVFLNLGD